MDATVAAALSNQVTTFKTDALTQIGTVLPIALPVVVTVALVFLAIRLFRAIAHI